jgi:hypothetical protein
LVSDGACDSVMISDNKLGNVRESTQSGRGYYAPPVRNTSGCDPDEEGEVTGLENAGSGEHSSGMVDKFRARLLEAEITPEPPLWHWQVFSGCSSAGVVLCCQSAKTPSALAGFSVGQIGGKLGTSRV